MMVCVGWRTLLLPLDEEPSVDLAHLLGQIVEAAAFHGVEGPLVEPEDYPGM